MRSPVTARSDCANASNTLRVKRPIEVVVLNCWGDRDEGDLVAVEDLHHPREV
jgi:hypothetical protein